MGKWFLARTTSASWFHCSAEGSAPVGLCAHEWKRMIERSGADWRSETNFEISAALISPDQYEYGARFLKPARLKMSKWLPQVGFE